MALILNTTPRAEGKGETAGGLLALTTLYLAQDPQPTGRWIYPGTDYEAVIGKAAWLKT